MNILIAGCGIGGLAAALSLYEAGFRDLRLVEAAPAVRPRGAGVNLQPNAVRELAALGLYEQVSARAAAIARLGYHNHLGQTVWHEPRGRAAGHRYPQLAVHRGELLTILADAVTRRLGPDAIRTDAKVTGFERTGTDGLRVRLAHRREGAGVESTTEAALLIGADGIHSAVRAALYPHEGAPHSGGTVVWRGITRVRSFLGGDSMVVMGDGRWKAVVYPLAGAPGADGLVPVNWAASRAAPAGEADDRTRPVPRTAFAPHFAHWRVGDLRLREVLAGPDDIVQFPLIDRDPLPRWSFGRVTLLGDSAHAMAPMGSNATTQAIVDARALAHALAHDRADPDRALLAYDRERRPAMNRLALMSRAKGPEAVIDLACERAPHGFRHIGEVADRAELAALAEAYARAGQLDPPSANEPSPYGVPAPA
ncbi:FAD-dependent monooxygenase [Streptomyces harbinensis]|uniref:2-polyprenyl-6-methoxyphenol hydroxylase n=1 Tax=Streptomyces harbinensis TaxID=1176198 RepID=A0A1I6TB37_9ACTN|nr:FAD-dependent monooxygenase [Streptomyces harbinensis]SFS86421.1 2-polyprenyl-6-methoxyphenol hydroxylase [Streptomyces harbinensis]